METVQIGTMLPALLLSGISACSCGSSRSECHRVPPREQSQLIGEFPQLEVFPTQAMLLLCIGDGVWHLFIWEACRSQMDIPGLGWHCGQA